MGQMVRSGLYFDLLMIVLVTAAAFLIVGVVFAGPVSGGS